MELAVTVRCLGLKLDEKMKWSGPVDMIKPKSLGSRATRRLQRFVIGIMRSIGILWMGFRLAYNLLQIRVLTYGAVV